MFICYMRLQIGSRPIGNYGRKRNEMVVQESSEHYFSSVSENATGHKTPVLRGQSEGTVCRTTAHASAEP